MHKGVLSNLGFLIVGGTLFFTSFIVGESTWIGGIMHLSGCAFFCCGVHRKWLRDSCAEKGCCPGESK
jgi:hypothetical protein